VFVLEVHYYSSLSTSHVGANLTQLATFRSPNLSRSDAMRPMIEL
jgi:hypothetical protein